MDLTIKSFNGELPLRIRRYAEDKASKLDRYFRDLQRLELVVGKERGLHVAELTAEGDGTLLRSQERNSDLHAAIGNVIAKLERQALKFKARLRDERRKPPSDDEGEAEPFVEEEGFTPVVMRRKRYAMKPMAVEEAARQMELLGHDFFLFRNVESGEINAIYRRQNGGYGLIEPE